MHLLLFGKIFEPYPDFIGAKIRQILEENYPLYMSNLYKELAPVYEAMYQTFIDYKAEYILYSSLLKKYEKQQVVEIGCGTGNLVSYFIENGFEYIGLDLSEEMINLAKKKANNCEFIQGDMRDFSLKDSAESIIITARTISYLLTNEDVNAAFSNIFNNLKLGSILCFDFIDANKFIPLVADEKEIIHEAVHEEIRYVRKSDWSLKMTHGMDFEWNAIYYKKEDADLIELGQDHSFVRAFTVDEIEIFLSINGFQVKEIIKRPSYFFPTYVILAEKIL